MYCWFSLLLFMFFVSFQIGVDCSCSSDNDFSLEVVKPVGNKKITVPTGKETTLEVRYSGKPLVRWYLNGKHIPMNSKSKFFEFVKGGPSLNELGPILKIKNFKKGTAGKYKVVVDNNGCVKSKIITVNEDRSFSLHRSINDLFEKVPFLKTKVGMSLIFLGFAFVFIIFPLMICCALCSKIRKLRKELDTEKGKVEMYYDYEHKKKSHKPRSEYKKASTKDKEPLIKRSSSSDDLPSARPKTHSNKK